MLKRFGVVSLVVALTAWACTTKSQDAPALSGPSELGLSLSLTASPDTVNQDGASQASLAVLARDASGKPVSGVALQLAMAVSGVPQDYGTLSAKSIVTNSDGKASAIYTAPPAPAGNAAVAPGAVTITATPIGTNAQAAVARTVDIRLVQTGVILPPAATPVAQFTYSPTPVNLNIPVTFDASASCGGPLVGGACTTAVVSYSWNFGDGTAVGTGKTVNHTFTGASTFNVTLTVTNDRGVTNTSTQQVSAAASAAPTASFVFSPTAPTAGQAVVFNADATKAATGRTITQYSWIFGDGTSATGFLATHTFTTAGGYNVTLTVVDDVGQRSTVSQTVNVAAGGGSGGATVAKFTFSPSTPSASQAVFFNATTSTASTGHTLVTYAWDFGDGGSGTGVSVSHSFTGAGTYTVTLTVTDDIGQKGTVSNPVAVLSSGSGTLRAAFNVSPTLGVVSGTLVTFNANGSSPFANITKFDWDFGDGTVVLNGGPQINHTYNTAVGLTFQVTLTVTDTSGNVATTTGSVAVGAGTDPTAVFSLAPNPVTFGSAVGVDATASLANGGGQAITNYQWNWGDGTAVTTGVTQTHTYAAKGTYTITLTVTQTNGRQGTTARTVIVQ